jgi:NAD(P)-dependent dehydrogenase (short-subunit alcohol dehydrogenase family)
VKRILVIGGYGGFGARLSRRLAAAGHHVLVAGRNAAKARRFAATLDNAEGVVADREGDLGPLLAGGPLDLVIDAAGPFQQSDYRVPQACIDMGVPYFDLADARDFVSGIGALDKKARAAGVVVIAGASTAPALTGAVTRKLAEGLDRVDQVEIALAASAKITAGASVARAILSCVGRPLRLWRGGRWSAGRGWQEMRKVDMRAGAFALRRRVALIDVPDHALLPALLPGRPAVTFRAGNELGFQMWFLWLLSWPVRWGWLQSLSGLAGILLPLQRATAWLGGDRSGMTVTLTGRCGSEALERRWSVVAAKGDGPEIPTLAAVLLAEDLFAGRLAAGARTPERLLTLDRFEQAFEGLAIARRVEEQLLPPVLYARIMGAHWAALPPLVRAIHDLHGDAGAAGEGRVKRGRNPLARLMGRIAGFPPAGAYQLHVAFAEHDGRERWTRDFGGHVFSSELSTKWGLVVERFGPMRFGFALDPAPDGLAMQLRRWSMFGIRLPCFLAPRIVAREYEADARFRFDVRLSFPLIGLIAHYEGWLTPIR